MELRQLECFVKAIEMNSMSRAADALFITQPALSLSIKALERELGVQLIIREKRRITLSPVGSIIYEHAHRLLEESLHIYRIAASSTTPPQNTLTVKVIAASALIPELIQ